MSWGGVHRLLEPPLVPQWMPWACTGIAAALLAFLALTQVMVGLAIVAATHHLVSAVALGPVPPAVRLLALRGGM